MSRRLVSLRRPVPPQRAARYAELWSALAQDAVTAGAHAWRFVAADDADLRLEFLEFKGDADPRIVARTGEWLAHLEEEIGPAAVEEWQEDR